MLCNSARDEQPVNGRHACKSQGIRPGLLAYCINQGAARPTGLAQANLTRRGGASRIDKTALRFRRPSPVRRDPREVTGAQFAASSIRCRHLLAEAEKPEPVARRAQHSTIQCTNPSTSQLEAAPFLAARHGSKVFAIILMRGDRECAAPWAGTAGQGAWNLVQRSCRRRQICMPVA